MTSFATSADGTSIAFDQVGAGDPLVIVNGLLCTRQTTSELAEHLGRQFAVINYDRRGRGESGDTAPYAVEREIDDLAALVAIAGGGAAVYGHSSGAGLALLAAVKLPIARLILHEPPYGTDDEESVRNAAELSARVHAALADGRRSYAIACFFEAAGLPPEMVGEISNDPARVAIAHTLAYDFAVMGDDRGAGAIPEDLVRAIRIRTLVMAGGEGPEFFRDTATRLAALLPNGRHVVLEGHDHGAPASAVAPVISTFLSSRE